MKVQEFREALESLNCVYKTKWTSTSAYSWVLSTKSELSEIRVDHDDDDNVIKIYLFVDKKEVATIVSTCEHGSDLYTSLESGALYIFKGNGRAEIRLLLFRV